MISFLTLVQVLILKFAGCKFLLIPIPGEQGDQYAAKWICHE